MKNELLQLINECSIISFDIFDTLIFRNIFKPTDIFKILDNYASKKYNIKDFYTLRIDSEKESRTDINNFESNYDEIYDEILKKIKKKSIVDELKKKELDLELEFCVANPFMKEIFEYCLKKNKKIVFISDMYLNKDFIVKILNKNGYKNVEVYVSCEVRKNKGSSELFNYVYEKEKINKAKWLHIGDNTHSDYNVPIEFGIKAFNYPKVSNLAKLEPNTIMESICFAIMCNYLYNGKDLDYWDKFGVEYVSLIYFGFTKWLYELTKNKENLYFLARDGYIPYRVYDKFNREKKVFTSYLYCSRTSIQIPSLILDDKDILINKLTQEVLEYNEMSLKEYLNNAQVNLEKIDLELIRIFGFTSLEDNIDTNNRENAKKLVAYLYDNIRNELLNDYNLAIKYLEYEGMNNYQKINVMDIGWGGSIQSAISKLLNKEVIGYYFGTINLEKKDSFTNMFGYYFDLDKPIENKEKIISNVMMYEFIFSAPHGTTIGYKEEGNKIIPILSKNIKYEKAIELFQKSALDIIDEYFKYINYFDYLDRDFCLKNYQDFLANPSYNDLKKFSELSNEFILGSQRQFNYVNGFTLDDIKNNPSDFCDKVSKSLWKDAFYIIDSNNLKRDYMQAKCIYNREKYLNESLIPLKCAKIYLDYGKGFKEEDIFLIPYKYDGNYVKFDLLLDDEVKGVRIDPVEGSKIKIKNLIINTNKGNAKVSIPYKNHLRSKLERCIYIETKDPRIILKNVDNLKLISFSAIIEII